MSNFVINQYIVSTPETMKWADTGYGCSSVPTITNSQLTASTDVTQITSGYRTGCAISTTTGNLELTVTGVTTGDPPDGGLTNTMIGLTSISTPAAICGQDMGANFVACIQFLTSGVARVDNVSVQTVAYDSGDTFKITLVGTTCTFYKNDVSFGTTTVAAGAYYVYCAADDSDRTENTYSFV